MIGKVLFSIAKAPFMGRIIAAAFRYASKVIPVRKVHTDKQITAFYHPKPSYENHIVIVPKRSVRDLRHMAEGFAEYFEAVFRWADAQSGDFVLLANGGRRQEVQQVHFHFFTGHKVATDCPCETPPANPLFCSPVLSVCAHPDPNWELHFVILPASDAQVFDTEYCKSVLAAAVQMDERYSITAKGYSLVYQRTEQMPAGQAPIFHITAGKKLKQAA